MPQSGISRRAPVLATIESVPDANWGYLMNVLGAGFFHSPASLGVALPQGEPVYVLLHRGSVLVGMGVGVSQRCRLGARTRHVRFAAPPAIVPEENMGEALAATLDALGRTGAVEVVFGSFGASGELPLGDQGRATSERIEYRVGLDTTGTELLAHFASTHRRHCRRGEREGWELRMAGAEEAPDLLYRVQSSAETRASLHNNPFATSRLRAEAGAAFVNPGSDFGIAFFGAEHDGELLAGALVGWGGVAAFYLRGGSTPRGYAEHAAAWLHWRIMCLLREHGARSYNLGGTPAAAADTDHPQNGLHRFKSQFGPEVIGCRGARWELSPIHSQLHSLVQRFTRPR